MSELDPEQTAHVITEVRRVAGCDHDSAPVLVVSGAPPSRRARLARVDPSAEVEPREALSSGATIARQDGA